MTVWDRWEAEAAAEEAFGPLADEETAGNDACRVGPRPGKAGNTMGTSMKAQLAALQAQIASITGTVPAAPLATFSFNGEWISFGLSEAPKNPKNAAPRICGLTGATIPVGAAIFYDRRNKTAALASAVVARYPALFKA